MTNEATNAEMVGARKLEKEMYGTRLRFKPGQYKARKTTENTCVLSYVDQDGALCIVPVEWDNGDWVGRGLLVRIGMYDAMVRGMRVASRISSEGQTACEVVNQKRQGAPA